AADYHRLMQSIRDAVPGVAITTDVMVGFPGETEEEFATSYRFIEEQEFAGIHVFPYSIRHRTTASKLPNQVGPEEKHRRTEAMLALAARSAARFRQRFLGQVVPVLYEGSTRTKDGSLTWEGLTDNYLRVRVESDIALTNQVVATRLEACAEDGIRGILLGPVPEIRQAGADLNILSAASR
ncbi:MAG TPA: hypothetical protein VKX96_14080, partial [Chloroflexota bacterium]|nr:hypothetical protein [Chloroflexota bacterium]